jgi:uncharacterized repeat protein (TIGR03837 family)
LHNRGVTAPTIDQRPLSRAAPPASPAQQRWDVFCRVIDNHGDLGVCWRLVCSLAGRGQRVRLWVDDASALSWMAPQGCAGVEVRSWFSLNALDLPGDVVVEAFGCDPPQDFVTRMAQRAASGKAAGDPAPVWINLEYLSAEAYVERSHGLASPQFGGPGAGLIKWFFYPGFTPRTGGLLREPGWVAARDVPELAVHRAEWLARFGGAAATDARLALLFCYDHPALPAWLDLLSQAGRPWYLLVTPGLATQAVLRWCAARAPGLDLAALGAAPGLHIGSLGLLGLPPVDQEAFDRLLCSCDLNFVRGEDSFVRAHWTGRPFLWQAYVQQDGAHHPKVAAWLQTYADTARADLGNGLGEAHRHWNGSPGAIDPAAQPWLCEVLTQCGPAADEHWAIWSDWANRRAARLAELDDLVTQLLRFVAEKQVRQPG